MAAASKQQAQTEFGASPLVNGRLQIVDTCTLHPSSLLFSRYIAGLLARLPTLTSIQLTDCLGWTEAPAAPTDKPGRGHAVALGCAGGRAGTPGLLGGAAAAGSVPALGGWRREVTETPVEGGLPQWDLRYSRAGGAAA